MKYKSAQKLIDRCKSVNYVPDYHFDADMHDPEKDCIIRLGKLKFNLSDDEYKQIIDSSMTMVCELGKYGAVAPGTDVSNYNKNVEATYVINNGTYVPTLGPDSTLQKIVDSFCLDNVEARVHVQLPGQVWNVHIDKLFKWMNPTSKPSDVIRITVHLTDWEPGHFISYGNYMHSNWKIGDVYTFDWINVPHCTANAGLIPRMTLLITGLRTEKTTEFLESMKTNSPTEINL